MKKLIDLIKRNKILTGLTTIITFLGLLQGVLYLGDEKLNIFTIIYSFIIICNYYTPNIPLWIHILINLILFLLLYHNYLETKKLKNSIFVQSKKITPQNPKIEIPEQVKNYKKQEIKNIIWTWDYLIKDDSLQIISILPHCKNCNSELAIVFVDQYNQKSKFHCENCNKDYQNSYYDFTDNMNMAKRIIRPKVKELSNIKIL